MTRNGAVFAVCLILALALLFLNKLSRKYIGEIRTTIHYTNMPEGKTPTTPLPADIKLFIETSGFKLVWAKLMKPREVQINLSSLKTNYMPTSELQPVVASQLSADYKLIDIQPDTLFFNFDTSVEKKVPVIPDILISFKKQYDFMEPMIIQPDSITVRGPQNAVDTIGSWKTERLLLENLDKSRQDELPLLAPASSSILIEPKKIKYIIPVEEYTEKTMEIGIERQGVPGSRQVNIYPNKAKVIFRVGLSNYEHVSPETFKVVADFTGVDLKRGKYVPVKIERAPPYIKNLDYSPKSVEYIIYR